MANMEQCNRYLYLVSFNQQKNLSQLCRKIDARLHCATLGEGYLRCGHTVFYPASICESDTTRLSKIKPHASVFRFDILLDTFKEPQKISQVIDNQEPKHRKSIATRRSVSIRNSRKPKIKFVCILNSKRRGQGDKEPNVIKKNFELSPLTRILFEQLLDSVYRRNIAPILFFVGCAVLQ